MTEFSVSAVGRSSLTARHSCRSRQRCRNAMRPSFSRLRTSAASSFDRPDPDGEGGLMSDHATRTSRSITTGTLLRHAPRPHERLWRKQEKRPPGQRRAGPCRSCLDLARHQFPSAFAPRPDAAAGLESDPEEQTNLRQRGQKAPSDRPLVVAACRRLGMPGPGRPPGGRCQPRKSAAR